MKIDYHMHFEHGSYNFDWVEGFFQSAAERGLTEIGISEHSHTFREFEHFYYDDLILDNSPIGLYQQEWLTKGKFRYSLDDYFAFMDELKRRGKPVKTGIEVCNFQNQAAVKALLAKYPFDYIIGSVHYINGWGYDFSAIKDEWDKRELEAIYDDYAGEVENLCSGGCYDVLGHPFNIRLFKYLPDGKFDAAPYLKRVAKAMKKADMIVDINTGTRYRYPIAEISPYPDFLKIAYDNDLPIITTSDAHEPEDCGRYIDDAIAYAKSVGYRQSVRFAQRQREMVALG